MFIAIIIVLASCGKKEETPTMSTSESKDKLDESLTTVTKDLEGITSLESIDAMESVMNSEVEPPYVEDMLPDPADIEGTSIEDMENALEEGLVNLTLSDQILWGTYTYNFTTEGYDYTPGTVGELIVKFPSSDALTSNDIELVLNVTFKDDVNYDAFTTTYYYEEENTDTIWSVYWDYNGDGIVNEEDYYVVYYYEPYENDVTINLKEIFTDVNLTIKQNSTTLLAFDFSVTLDDNDYPNYMTSSLSVESYKVTTTFDATNRAEKVTHSTSFSKDDNELLGYDITFSGNTTDDRIEEIYNELETAAEDEVIPSDEFLSSLDYDFAVELRVGDFVITGLVDGSKVYDAYHNYPGDPEDFDDNSLEDNEYLCNEINKATSLLLKYNNGAAVGYCEWFVTDYTDDEWDYETQTYSEVTYYYPSMRFVFEDGTYISPEDENAEDELEKIFGSFLDEIDKLSSDIEDLEDRL